VRDAGNRVARTLSATHRTFLAIPACRAPEYNNGWCERNHRQKGAIETLFDAVMAGDGQSPAEVAAWFNVPIAAVDAAVTYERMFLEESSPLAA
jgi:hypothetical protein